MNTSDTLYVGVLAFSVVVAIAGANPLAAVACLVALGWFYRYRQEQALRQLMRANHKHDLQKFIATLTHLKKPLVEGQVRIFDGGWEIDYDLSDTEKTTFCQYQYRPEHNVISK